MTVPSDFVEERQGQYPFSEWQLKLQEAILNLKGRPRHCAVHAFRGLKRAWLIAPIDPEMAYFRALTAEEEAATALIFALKHRRYPGADKIDYNYHPHKAGIAPFLGAIETVFAEAKFPAFTYKLDYESTPPRLDVRIPSEKLGMPAGYFAELDEPLNGFFQNQTDKKPTLNIFDGAMNKFAEIKGEKSVIKAIQQEANIRNRLLYASDDGIPHVKNVDDVLRVKGRPITAMLTLTIAILQTRKHQLLVPQAIEEYLNIFNRAPDERFDYSTVTEPAAEIQIEIQIDRNGVLETKINKM